MRPGAHCFPESPRAGICRGGSERSALRGWRSHRRSRCRADPRLGLQSVLHRKMIDDYMIRAFSAYSLARTSSWGVAPGFDETAPLALTANFVVSDAISV